MKGNAATRLVRSCVLVATFGLAQGCLVACASAPAAGPGRSIASEVRLFLNAYANDLRGGNREAIAARYHPQGAYLLGNGAKSFESFAELRSHYLTAWQPPSAFEWCDLSIEPISNDAAVVAGRFVWQTAKVHRYFSYAALLVRHEGTLRIRLEDESQDPDGRESGCSQP